MSSTICGKPLWGIGLGILVSAITLTVYLLSGPGDRCDTVGISNVDCAVLYDEENCDTGSDMLRVKPGDSGRLSKWSPFTSSLQRNDLESLIVRAHCKLELWDDDDGIDNMQPPDIVIDNTLFSVARYIDSFENIASIRHLDESISAYRCTCKEPDMTVKFWKTSSQRRHEYSDVEIARLFVILDEDRDKSLDEKEIIQWAADVGLSWSSAEAREIIKTADFDTNNKLNSYEFLILMHAINKMRQDY